MKVLVVGSSGRIGSEIKKQFKGYELICPDREVYSTWHKKESVTEILNFVQFNQVDAIFICSGIMNSNEDKSRLIDVNFSLPVNIIDATRLNKTRVVTFGTIMELTAPGCNEYVRSKQKLQEFIDLEVRTERILSLKIHTVFGGGPPNEYMFLGQILDSLGKKSIFNMSAGTQLREYHHVEDVVAAAKYLFECGASGQQHISKGTALQLKDLAEYIFTYFDARLMLNIGAIAYNTADNFEQVMPENELLESIPFRDSRAAVASYLEGFLK